MKSKASTHITGQSNAGSEDNCRIVLSGQDWERFVQIMTSDAEPTQIALEEAKLFNQGHFDGTHYFWSEQKTPVSASDKLEG